MPTIQAQHGKSKFSVQIKSIAADGTFEGILASYNTVDLGGDSILPGAFTKTLQERGSVVPLLWQHKSDTPVGDLTLTDTPEALRFKGRLLLELDDAKKAYVLLKARVIKGMSIGFDTIKDSVENGVRQLKELRLWEGSIVTFPMNEAAMVTSVKMVDGKAVETKGDFNQEYAENQLRSAGYQMFDALCSALYSVTWASGMDKDQKIEAAQETIAQFQAAYMPYFSQYLDWLAGEWDMEMMSNIQHEHKAFAASMGRSVKTIRLAHEVKEGRKFSEDTMKSLKEAHGHVKDMDDIFNALFDDEADDDPEDPADDSGDDTLKSKAAAKTNTEPVTNHSAAEKILTEMRSLYRGA
jgi:HK97 family phage prohead protease